MSDKVEEILEFWLGPNHVAWFGGGEKVDKEVCDKYGDLVREAMEGKLDGWKEEPRSSLALILVCDQFCRNVNKNNENMIALDQVALELSHKFVVEQKTHNHLHFGFSERLFIYMPLEHSECREDQELSMQMFQKLLNDAKTPEEKEAGDMYLFFAKKHKEVIDRFGRYPQRNALLKRPNTLEEEEFLANLPLEYTWGKPSCYSKCKTSQ